jgi:hypothetical protein
MVSRLEIDLGELASGRYGASTAEAVLEYKRTRKIINFSYQTKADNIVGKMTIAALDAVVSRKERWSSTTSACPPKLEGSVGLGGANLPCDLAKVGSLLWIAGYGRAGAPLRWTGSPAWWLDPGPLPRQAVFLALRDFFTDHGISPHSTLRPDSALTFVLYRECLTG